jgi:alpha-glucoside transport system permease protein
MTMPAVTSAAEQRRVRVPEKGPPGTPRWLALLFLSPALVLLAVFIVYPLVYSVVQSLYDDRGEHFVALGNYRQVFTDPQIITAIKNTAVWVTVGPTTVCALGLVFAVLADRVRWASAFRLVLFMPMAISLFASGVIFRLMYEEQPDLGMANAVVVGVHDLVAAPSPYPKARPEDGTVLAASTGGLVTTASHRNGDVVTLPLVGMTAPLPEQAMPASLPRPAAGELRGLVWFDATPHSRKPGIAESDERGMPGIAVEALRDGRVVAVATTGDDGSFAFPDLVDGEYRLRLPAAYFTPPFRGQTWLGPKLITPVIISCWIWVMTGFALTIIAAGLSAIPREVIEAARVDGASESQILRRVTMPLLAPVLVVVFITLVVAVLKVFDLVFVIAPGPVRDDASVLALEIWRQSFGTGLRYGIGNALVVVLFLLVTPVMLINIRRLRRKRP